MIGVRETKSPLTGRNYCFQMQTLTVQPGSRQAMLNQYVHKLNHQTIGEQDEVYVSLWDLIRIFSPDWKQQGRNTLVCRETQITFSPDCRNVQVGSETMVLSRSPFEKEEWLYIPVGEVMEKIFGRYVWHLGSYLCIGRSEEDRHLKFDGPFSKELTKKGLDFRFGKTVGDRYFTVWMPEVERMNVYRMYIPSEYDGNRPFKLLLCLHGGNGNSDTVFIRSRQLLQYYAEEYGYILLAPNSYVSGSNYGGIIPPVHMFPEPDAGEMPDFYSEDERAENQIAQNYLKRVVDQVLGSWNIDRERIFVTGNSMGSIGTFHVLTLWPELFRAAAPTGAMPLTQYVDAEKIARTPLFFLAGTEDPNDAMDMKRRAGDLREKGVQIRFRMIGGGQHADAWVTGLKEIFTFFEQI